MKLIWNMFFTDGCTYTCTDTVPFEYSSKDDFILYVWGLIDEAKKKNPNYPSINVLGYEDLSGETIANVENDIFTLDEWFEQNKKTT
jgi:hypothetical protein